MAWGESRDLSYLPVFRQTYEDLRRENMGTDMQDVDAQYSLESFLNPPPVHAPESYPIPNQERAGSDVSALAYNFGNLSIEEKKHRIEVTRNSLELLSSMLNTEEGTKSRKDDLMVSLAEKCKQSQPMIQMIIESTNDDEGLLFEALNLNDELQQVVSKYEELESSIEPMEQPSQDTNTSTKSIEQPPIASAVVDPDSGGNKRGINVVENSGSGENKRENPGKLETAESSGGQRDDK